MLTCHRAFRLSFSCVRGVLAQSCKAESVVYLFSLAALCHLMKAGEAGYDVLRASARAQDDVTYPTCFHKMA